MNCLLLVCALTACTKHNPANCTSDADCHDPTRPFCDLNGDFPESNYSPNSCSVIPAGCPIDRCGCTAGADLSCAGDQLTTCGADGHSTTTSTCVLGCSTQEPRCLTFEPSNGLGPALLDAANEPDVVIPSGSTIDTTLGVVKDGSGTSITIKSTLVPQSESNSMIRVFEGQSFAIDNVTVSGTYAVAFVAPNAIVVQGLIDASATIATAGPGAQESPAQCAGENMQTQPSGCTLSCYAYGAGGGGNGTAGGPGGGNNAFGGAGGALVPTFVPLVGGCRGGKRYNSDGTTIGSDGGGGGGAIQLVSLSSIELSTLGAINVGGGGGHSTAGGGSGGTVVLEAPAVSISGVSAGVFANGGSGGGCNSDGLDGLLSSSQAMGPRCSPDSAGDGGTSTYPATPGQVCSGTCQSVFFGGGGGSVGRVRIATKDGTYAQTGNAVVSALVMASMLTLK